MPKQSNAVLSALRVARPDEFRAQVRAAIVKAGTVARAAAELGMPRGTVFRWVAEAPEIVEGLDLPPARAVERGGKAPRRAKVPREDDPAYEGVVAYLAPAPASLPKLPAHLGVRIVVDRLDGGNLTAEDLAAAAAAFPRALPKKPSALKRPRAGRTRG